MLPWKATFLRLFTPAVPSSLPLSLSASLFLSPSLLSPGLQSCVSQLLGKHFHLDTPDTWNSPFPKLHTSFPLLKVLLSWVPPVHEQESPTIHLLPTLETQSPWLLFLHHSASHQFCLYDDKTVSWNQQFLSVPLLTTATMTNPFLSISLTTLTWTSPVPFHSASDHISMLPHNPQNKNQFLNKTDRVLPVFWLLSPWLPQLRLPL